MTKTELQARLQTLAEPEYAAFSAALVPGCTDMLGVRLPTLRKLARELATDVPAALAILPAGPDFAGCFEERMLLGMTLAAARLPDPQRQTLLEERWLPLLAAKGNWSLCDSPAASCKFMAKAPDVWLPWLQALANDGREFPARFALVCLLDHFTDTPAHRRLVLEVCAAAPGPALYVRLAVAWAVSVVAAKEPPLGLAFLRQQRLDSFTQNKAIQKTCESRRLDADYKAQLRQYRLPKA